MSTHLKRLVSQSHLPARSFGGALLVFCMVAASAAHAQTSPGTDAAWTTTVTPYVWAASAKGHSVSQGMRTEIDIPFSHTLKHLDVTGMAQVEFRKGKAGFWIDGNYTKVSEDQEVMTMPVKVQSSTRLSSAAGFMQAYATDTVAIEPYVGLRDTRLKISVDTPVSSSTDRIGWTDAFIGARVKLDLNESWKLTASLDMSGLGSKSQRSEFGQIGVGYKTTLFDKPATITAGYRALHQRYESGGFEYNVTQSGLGVGLGVQF